MTAFAMSCVLTRIEEILEPVDLALFDHVGADLGLDPLGGVV